MSSSEHNLQRFAVALLMVTLLGPVGGGLAGIQVGAGVEPGVGALHADMDSHATAAEPGSSHPMAGHDCAEPGQDSPRRCAGLWSTACCDYFAPGTKIRVEPSPESDTQALDVVAFAQTYENRVLAAAGGHLILPTAGEGRAGPTSLIILHSSLLL